MALGNLIQNAVDACMQFTPGHAEGDKYLKFALDSLNPFTKDQGDSGFSSLVSQGKLNGKDDFSNIF